VREVRRITVEGWRKRGGTNSFALFGKIGKLSDKDVNEDFEVVGVKVLLRSGRGEEEVKDLEDEQLHAKVLGGVFYEQRAEE
jgi:hypothetical protein